MLDKTFPLYSDVLGPPCTLYSNYDVLLISEEKEDIKSYLTKREVVLK